MQTSESIQKISAALLAFHKEVGSVAKESVNPFFKAKYADLSTILKTIDEPLCKNGLVIIQFPEGDHELTTRLQHESGEWMQATYKMQPVKNTPQDAGSVITYQRRYAIGAILSLNIDEDDDGNKASTNGKNGQDEYLVQWQQTIWAIKKPLDLIALYNGNKETVDADPRIKELFKKQEAKIKPKK